MSNFIDQAKVDIFNQMYMELAQQTASRLFTKFNTIPIKGDVTWFTGIGKSEPPVERLPYEEVSITEIETTRRGLRTKKYGKGKYFDDRELDEVIDGFQTKSIEEMIKAYNRMLDRELINALYDDGLKYDGTRFDPLTKANFPDQFVGGADIPLTYGTLIDKVFCKGLFAKEQVSKEEGKTPQNHIAVVCNAVGLSELLRMNMKVNASSQGTHSEAFLHTYLSEIYGCDLIRTEELQGDRLVFFRKDCLKVGVRKPMQKRTDYLPKQDCVLAQINSDFGCLRTDEIGVITVEFQRTDPTAGI